MRDILEFVPDAVLITMIFIVGTFFGSFMNVVIYRLPRKCLSIAKPAGSFCPKCKAKIKWYDNIPILSYIILGAKCRVCKDRISFRYPAVEFLTGLLFAIFFWEDILSFSPAAVNYTNWLLLLSHVIAVFLLLSIAFIDFDLMIIPDSFSIGGAIIMLIFAFLNPMHGGFMPDNKPIISRVRVDHALRLRMTENFVNPQVRTKLINQGPFNIDDNKTNLTQMPVNAKFTINRLNWVSLKNAVFSMILGGVGLFVLSLLMTLVFLKKARQYGGGMALGMGDVKLYLFFGAMLGWPALPMILIVGSFIGVLFGIPLLLTKSKHVMPFGPSLVAAALLILMFYGPLLRLIADYFYK